MEHKGLAVSLITTISSLAFAFPAFSEPKAIDLSPDPGYTKSHTENGVGTWYKAGNGSVLRINNDGTRFYRDKDGIETSVDISGFRIEYNMAFKILLTNQYGQRYVLKPDGSIYKENGRGEFMTVYRGFDYTRNGVNIHTGEYNPSYDQRRAFAAHDPTGSGGTADMAPDMYMDKELAAADYCMFVNGFYAVKYPGFDFAREIKATMFKDPEYKALEEAAIYGANLPDVMLRYIEVRPVFDVSTACEAYKIINGTEQERQAVKDKWARRYGLFLKHVPTMRDPSDKWNCLAIPDWEARKRAAMNFDNLARNRDNTVDTHFRSAYDRFLQKFGVSKEAQAYLKMTGASITVAEYCAWVMGTKEERTALTNYHKWWLDTIARNAEEYRRKRERWLSAAEGYRQGAIAGRNYVIAEMWAAAMAR